MKLATHPNGTPDGELVIVSTDLSRAVSASGIAANLQTALENWAQAGPALGRLAEDLAAGRVDGDAFDPLAALAPLPRAWQWLDGSAFPMHGELMQKAFNLPPIETDRPLMYQGLSDRFLAPSEPVPLPSEEDGIDFEGEFGVIVDAVPMGITPEDAREHIRLIVQINDWSLRTIAPIEMKTGFGWVQAKPACSMAAAAITPDELGGAWREGRVCLPLEIDWNGTRFGAARGDEMEFGFHELVAHAARTRDLVAGTIIGSGTVSNTAYAEAGSSCISERRAIDMIEFGEIRTPFMAFGDTIRMNARDGAGHSIFGAIEQKIVRA
ncbi:fumarylacetoacetate hydrolase family protein [Maricaulis parjimensis]|uniref:fumarylacetoacetate hydrolase family protein n=1 Tax=Maricaulis parjimensis TaxID=144023 RepID=UPI00193A632A|nr:fumarylacetoacetate hydrolase family protein [Maricaulis parjimensis]